MANLSDCWQELRSSPRDSSRSGFCLRLLESLLGIRVYAGVAEPHLAPAVVVELPDEACPRRMSLLSSRAFDTSIGHFPGFKDGHSGIAVQLRDASYEDLFTVLCTEMVAAVHCSGSPSQAGRAVVRCIERWRRFLDRSRRLLTHEQVRGLVGELVVLARCISRFGPRVALNAWTGPEDALRDFELPDASVEVKTYQSSTGCSVRINDTQQLDEVVARPVYLVAVHLVETETRGRSLAGHVEVISSLLSDDVEALDAFEDKLADTGYLPVHGPDYPQRFVIETLLLHKVQPGFPRIRPSDVPSGVVEVQFSILLSSLGEYVVDADPVIGSPVLMLEECH